MPRNTPWCERYFSIGVISFAIITCHSTAIYYEGKTLRQTEKREPMS